MGNLLFRASASTVGPRDTVGHLYFSDSTLLPQVL